MRLFDVKHQLIFYGQYHSNKYNVAIHIFFVPIILWTSAVLLAGLPTPSFFPSGTYHIFPPYLYFQWSWAVLLLGLYTAYYLVLEPVAALLYMPLLSLMLLSTSPMAASSSGTKVAAWLMAFSWIAQFIGHGVAEKRAPALLDNLLGALVLAPFFVHLEILFAFGYRPEFHREITNGVSMELVKFRKEQGEARRGKA